MSDVTFVEPWVGGNGNGAPPATPGLLGFPGGQLGPDYFKIPSGHSVPHLGGVVRGKIIQSFASVNLYDITTDGKNRILALYMGGNSSGGSDPLGTQQVVAFYPGTEVWVIITPATPGVEGLILGSASRPVRGYLPQRFVLGYPQVAGLDLQQTSVGPPKVFSGNHTTSRQLIKSQRGILKDLNSANADLVDGDWVVLNYYGGGVGVESFKTWVGAGPMNSLTIFPEDEVTRLTGVNFQFATMSEDYEDLRVGRTMRSIRRKVYFPGDTLLANPPQVLEVDGPSYIGVHKIITYRNKDNAHTVPTGSGAPAVTDMSRSALIHEYRGSDGTFVLTAAASLTLQKWVGVQSPIELGPVPATTTIDLYPNASATFTSETKLAVSFPAPDPRLEETSLEADANQLEVLSDSGVGSVVDVAGLGSQASIYAAVYAGNRVLSTLGYQVAKAFKTYANLWKYGAVPRFLQRRGDSAPRSDAPDWPDPSNYDVAMWKRVPKSVIINLNSYGMSKRIFLGRALITITDEGGITLQDAFGSQIVMSGGNIYLTAEHDVITNAGRNCVTLAGQDASTMAFRNVDSWADSGHMTLGASLKLSMIGGNSGYGGVNVESRAINTGVDDGLFIRSNSRITALGHSVDLKAATGSLSFSANTPIVFQTSISNGNYGVLSSDGIYFASNDTSTLTSYLSIYGSYMPGLSVQGRIQGESFAQVNHGSSPLGPNRTAYAAVAAAAALTLFRNDYSLGITMATGATGATGTSSSDSGDVSDRFSYAYGPRFLQSAAYSIPDTDSDTASSDMFALPEGEWQRRVDAQDAALPGGVALRSNAAWKINSLRASPYNLRLSGYNTGATGATGTALIYPAASMPYPGYDLWRAYGYVPQTDMTRNDLTFTGTTIAGPMSISGAMGSTGSAGPTGHRSLPLNNSHRGI